MAFGGNVVRRFLKLFVIVNFILFAFGGQVFAETYTWNGIVSSDWGDAGNWDETSATPDGYNIILAKGTPYDVDFSTRNTNDFDSLTIEEDVSIDVDLDITVINEFINRGTVNFSGTGVIFTCGSINNSGELNLGANDVACDDFENSGTLSFTGTLDVKNAVFNNVFTNQGNISIRNQATFANSVTNTGTIGTASGAIIFSGEVTNAGTISNNSGSTSFSGAVTNNGTITCGSGALVMEGNYSGSGELTLSSGTSTFNGGTVNFSDVTLNHNNGTIVFDRASTGGMFSSDATINLKVNNTTFNNVKFGDTNNVKMTVDGNLIVEGNFTATNPTSYSGQQQSTYKNITFSGSNKTISFAGKNTFTNVNITGSNNTVTFSSENTFTELNISGEASIVALASANTIGTLNITGINSVIKFGAGKTQTITNLTATGTSGNEILLTTNATSPSVNNTSTWWKISTLTSANTNIAYTKIEYSSSANLLHKNWGTSVSENVTGSTENWFLRDYYWFGNTNTSWDEIANWSSSENTFTAVPIVPLKDDVLINITVVTSAQNELVLDSAINVKNLVVNGVVDFASYNVTAAENIQNNGTIKLQGNQTITGSVVNGNDCFVEYYGNNFSSFAWGTNYRNLKLAENISGDFSSVQLNVQGNLIIANDASINLKGTFAGNIVLGDNGINAGTVTLTSSAAMKVSGNCSDLYINGTLSANNTLSSSGVISVNGDVTASGAITASGDISFDGNATVNEVTSQNGAISVSGTASLNADVTSDGIQTYSGAVTLLGDVTLVASEVTFASTVNSQAGRNYSLTIGNDLVTTNVIFTGTVGQTTALNVLSVKGNLQNANKITSTGDISVGGDVLANGVISSGGAISVTGMASLNADVTASGTQTYSGAVTLLRDVTLVASDVTFVSSVDSNAGNVYSLTLGNNSVLTNVNFTGNVGQTIGIKVLSVKGNLENANKITTTGNISVSGDVLANGVISSGGVISVGGVALLNADVTSGGTQIYSGAVTLARDVTLVATEVTFASTVNSQVGNNYSLTIGNDIVFTKANFNGNVGNLVPLGNILIFSAAFAENASLIQTETSSFTIRENSSVQFGKGKITVGSMFVETGSEFVQTGINTEEQLFNSIENNGTVNFDATNIGGTLSLKGDISGSNANSVAFNKKNVSIKNNLVVSGIFYDLEIPQNISVTNGSEICVRNNFKIDGTYVHNDKVLLLGQKESGGKTYTSGPDGNISGNANTAFGSVEVVQKNTPKNFDISGTFVQLKLNDTSATGEISFNKNSSNSLVFENIENNEGTKFEIAFYKTVEIKNNPTINTTGIIAFENQNAEKATFTDGITFAKTTSVYAKGTFENTNGSVNFVENIPLNLRGNFVGNVNSAIFDEIKLNSFNFEITSKNLVLNKNVSSNSNGTNSFVLKNLGTSEIKTEKSIFAGKITFEGNGSSSVSVDNINLVSLSDGIFVKNESIVSGSGTGGSVSVKNKGAFVIDESSKITCKELVQNGEGENQIGGTITATENLSFVTNAFVKGSFNCSATKIIASKDFFINGISSSAAKAVVLNCDVQIDQNFALLNGNVTLNGNLTVSKDIILLNGTASEIYKDSASGIANLFAYINSQRVGKTAACSLQAFPVKNPDGTSISLEKFASSIDGFAGKTIIAGQNFYSNGIDLVPSGSWNLRLKTNELATSAFAEFHNGKIRNCVVVPNSGKAYLACGENAENLGGNVDCYFSHPILSDTETYTVFDNVIRLVFVDSLSGVPLKIENSNNEISKAITSGAFVHKGNSGKISFQGTYIDSECTISTDGKGDLSEFYVKAKANENWNSDATGLSAGADESTDWAGIHRTAIPYVDLPKALNSLYETLRDEHKNRIAHYYSGNAFTGVKDKCSPVLIGIKTGQELHKKNTGTAESQLPHDSHNFIEFRYSESVNTSSILLADKDDLSKIMNIAVDSDFGEIISSQNGLVVSGIAKIQNGKIETGSTNAGITKTRVHSLYRNFSTVAAASEKFQSHRIRVGIASFVDTSVLANGKEFHHWPGYIDSAITPKGSVTPLDSRIVDGKKLIYDSEGNSLDVVGTNNHPLLALSVEENDTELYGEWDVYAPVFSEYKSPLYNASEKYYESIGTSSSGYSTLDKIEFHLHDNVPSEFDENIVWFNKVGWCKDSKGKVLYKDFSDATDIFGGARPFDDNSSRRTSGGIRYSSLYNKASYFKYAEELFSNEINKEFAPVEIIGGAKSLIFIPPIGNRKSTGEDDGLYFSVYLQDTSLPLKSVFTVSYDENACVTDLAGNRLRSQIINTIDRVSPKFNISVAEVKNNKLYVVFNKKLNIETISVYPNTMDTSDDAELYSALEKITESLRIVDSSWNPVSSIQIDRTVPAKHVYSNDYYTGLIFTLTADVTLADVKNLYLQCYAPETSMDPLSGISGVNVTYVQDSMGNYMVHKEAHALSDFAVGVVNPIFAYDNRQTSDENYFTTDVFGKNIKGSEGSYSVHDWNENQSNYGSLISEHDIFISAKLEDGTIDNSDLPERIVGYFDVHKNNGFLSISEECLSKKYNESISNADFALSPWRIWLPEKITQGTVNPEFKALANVNNPFDLFVEGVQKDEDDKTKMDFLLAYDSSSENAVYSSDSMKNVGWNKGHQISFLFGLENEDGSPIQICHSPEYNESTGTYNCEMSPLFALRLKNPKDLTSLDLWSFRLKNVALQRGGITILNNVINVSDNEKTILQVDVNTSDHLNIAVMTLDGNIVQYLHKGTLASGTHYFYWDGKTKGGKPVARGMYFVRIFGSGIDETRKIMVVKD